MTEIKVIYGSNTGETEAVAEEIGKQLSAEVLDVATVQPVDFLADLLILGTSTWGLGAIQEDWENKINLLDLVDLKGRKVAIFGLGDQAGYPDTFVDGMGELYDKVCELGAAVIGKTSAAGYTFSASTANKNGELCGLALDNVNESHMTAKRIKVWVEHLQKEMGLVGKEMAGACK